MSSSIVAKAASSIIPSKIPDFIKETRALADEMELMLGTTPVRSQSLKAAMIFEKYGCL